MGRGEKGRRRREEGMGREVVLPLLGEKITPLGGALISLP